MVGDLHHVVEIVELVYRNVARSGVAHEEYVVTRVGITMHGRTGQAPSPGMRITGRINWEQQTIPGSGGIQAGRLVNWEAEAVPLDSQARLVWLRGNYGQFGGSSVAPLTMQRINRDFNANTNF